MLTFEQLIARLNDFWSSKGVAIGQPYGLEVGAGTSNPLTAFRVLGPEPFNVAYVEPSRRPADGRYGENPNRLQHYFQYQIILKPAPRFNTQLYLGMLEYLGIDISKNDIRFVEDNWESPSLGAWGLGWEIWLNGMEVTQYTYFQQMAGIELEVPALEITIGLERLAMYLQGVDDYRKLKWNKSLTYGDIFERHEYWQSKYNYETSDIKKLKDLFNVHLEITKEQIDKQNYWAAYDNLLKLSHYFNLLDAKGVISAADRVAKFKLMGELGAQIAKLYLNERQKLGYPLKGLKGIEYSPELYEIQVERTKDVSPSPSDNDELLIEIGVEEIPAEVLIKASKVYTDLWLQKILKELGYKEFDARVYLTPQRIVFYMSGIPKEYKFTQEIAGPPKNIAYKDGKATQALINFLQKNNLSENELKVKDGRIFAEKEIVLTHTQTAEILLEKFIAEFPKVKFMKWQKDGPRFIRPVRWLLVANNSEVIKDINFMGIKSENFTLPPRYIEPTRIKITNAQNYWAFVKNFNIVLDHKEREAIIRQKLEQNDFSLPKDLISENTFLTENPHVEILSLPKKFEVLPYALIEKILAHHQRYIVKKTQSGVYFAVIINHNNQKELKNIAKQNLKVVEARLNDGLFYLNKDLSKDLTEYREDLKYVTYHPEKGSYYEKVTRINELADNCKDADTKDSNFSFKDFEKVIRVFKNDKATLTGKEFPELEGYIASQIARLQKYPKIVIETLEDYVKEKPLTPLGKYFALLDTIDDLFQLADVQGLPTGESDPYQLRQKVYRFLNIAIDMDFDLSCLVTKAYAQTAKRVKYQEFIQFILQRFNNMIKYKTHLPSHIREAVVWAEKLNFKQKTKLLRELEELSDSELSKIYDAVKRVYNILKKAESKPTGSQSQKNWGKEYLTRIEQQLLQFTKFPKYSTDFLLKVADMLEELFDKVLIMSSNREERKAHLAALHQVQENINSVFKYK